jgi:predicted SAM-dependent methyltransferase
VGLATRFSSRFRRPITLRADGAAISPSTTELVTRAYEAVLGRDVDPEGLALWGRQLESGQTSRDELIARLVDSTEFGSLRKALQKLNGSSQIRGSRILHALHESRVQVVKQLPKAEVIVDLGGSWAGRVEGALVTMGYPYRFKSLTIVDLPRDQRHEVYANICGEHHDVIHTPLGPVNYVYTSLAELSAFADESIDFVYSGQSIEHVTIEDAGRACDEVRRILKPGGYFCLDTPNRAVTVLQCPDHLINPDHRYEYTHRELSGLLESHGLVVREAKGLNLAAQSVAEGRFIAEELMDNPGVFDDIEKCYLLYYRCQKV